MDRKGEIYYIFNRELIIILYIKLFLLFKINM